MIKRYVTALLAVLLVVCWVFPAYAAETESVTEEPGKILTIETTGQFLSFAENCRLDSYSRDLTVELKENLDLSGLAFSGVPIFCGTFLGNGHTIAGLIMEGSGSEQGLFRYLTDTALVKDLSLDVTICPGGSRSTVGALAGENAGKIRNCWISGQIVGADQIGGVVGRNAVTGVIEDCQVSGSITGNHFLGGIAGENAGVIRNCKNTADINTSPQENQVALSDITLNALTQTESAATVTDVGGIAGTSIGVIRNCINRGTVGYRNMGYNVGGIVGSQSGTVLDSENHGRVWGRKEVGGIVGHLKPAAQVEYDEDALQILQRQLDAIGSTVNQTSGNVQSTAQSLTGKIYQMGDAVQDARDALSLLVPEGENPTLPDQDTLEAAKNGISDSLWGMTSALEGMSAATQNAMNALSANLVTLQQQVAAMGVTLGNVSQTLGGSIEDISDLDTEADLSGKVAGCTNTGSVQADLNAGGIAGAMALESELDAGSQLEFLGERSLNFISKVRCVVLDCHNTGKVTAGKQNIGGIAGFHSIGLIRLCSNSADVGSQGADHVGGIAGSGAIVTDCRSMVKLVGPTEKFGAVMGVEDSALSETEDPIVNNLYCVQDADYGGIDAISYQGKAEGLSRREFLKKEKQNDLFAKVTIRFCLEDGRVITRQVKTGEALEEKQIPRIPQRDGTRGRWQGLDQADLSAIWFDMTFDAVYDRYLTVIASEQTREDRPLMLLEGSFTGDSALSVQEADGQIVLPQSQWLVGSWNLRLEDTEAVTLGRLRIPQADADVWHVWVLTADDVWQERSCTQEDSYLVFALDGAETAVAVAGENQPLWYWYAAGAAVVALGAALLMIKKRK